MFTENLEWTYDRVLDHDDDRGFQLPEKLTVTVGTSGRFLSSEVFDCDQSTGDTCTKVRSVYVTYELDDALNRNDSTGKASSERSRDDKHPL